MRTFRLPRVLAGEAPSPLLLVAGTRLEALRLLPLLRACGLEWEPACLEHARAERPIATFSTVDARAPVEVRSGRAERYRAHLAPLVDALREAGVDPTSGELSAAD